MKYSYVKLFIISLIIFLFVSILFVCFIVTYHNQRLYQKIQNFYSKTDQKLHDTIVFAINKEKGVIVQYDHEIEDSFKIIDHIKRGFRSSQDVELSHTLPYEFRKTITKCCFICKMLKRDIYRSLNNLEQYLINKEFTEQCMFIYIELDHLLIHFISQKEEQIINLEIPIYKGSMMTRKIFLWYLRDSIFP